MDLPPAVAAFAQAVISIFAIVNPLGNLPAFVGMTDQLNDQERRRMFHLAALTALGIILAMALVGQVLLEHVFHISMNDFRFAGGLLLVLVGVRNMLFDASRRGHRTHDESARLEEQLNTAISPIAIPMLSGPGSIVTVMLLSGQHGRLFTSLACVTCFVVVAAILHWAHVFYRVIGRIGTRALGRVMQIFIIAIGVKFCFSSIAAFVQQLGSVGH